MVRQLPREAEMLRKASIEMGYTQQQVATLIGVHIKTLIQSHLYCGIESKSYQRPVGRNLKIFFPGK